MRSRVTNASINKDVLSRIIKLQRLYDAAIKPDNVGLVRSSVVEKAGSLLTSLKQSSGAGVNGVEFDDIAAYTNYLGSTNIEFMTVRVDEIVMDARTGTGTAEKEKKETVIDIPEGFDGRNAFVFIKLFGLCKNDADEEGDYSGQAIEAVNIPYTMNSDQWLLLTQAKKKVVINTLLRRSFVHQEETYDRLYARGYVLMWRKK